MRRQVNIEQTVQTLQRYATEIRTLKNQAADVLVRIGKRLADARALAAELPRAERNAQWARFLKEADISEATAKRFVRLAEAFGDNIPDMPVGRLDTIVKALAKPEERKAFITESNAATLPPEQFTEALERYKARAEHAEQRLAKVEKAVSDTPVKVIEANVALRRLDMALAQSIEAMREAGSAHMLGNVDEVVVRSVKRRTEEWFSLLAEIESGQREAR